MKLNEPIGDTSYGPLLVRLPLGIYFAMAGWAKLNQLTAFVVQVRDMAALPDNIATLYATMLPYVELYVGVAMVLGLWMTLSSILSSIMIFSFVIAFGFFPGENGIFNKDLLLLGASLSLLFSGAGAYSVDNVRRATAS